MPGLATSMPQAATAEELVKAARALRNQVSRLRFSPPVTHVYNPLDYAWDVHERYLRSYGQGPKRVLFLGMNPGPFGMVQTGVPFGEISAVSDWMKLQAPIRKPKLIHARRPVDGFDCHRTEISGQRLWGLFAQRFPHAADFFREHLVVNFCPLAFMEASGCNRTPDKLPAAESAPLFRACDAHLRRVVRALKPEWIIGVGDFAFRRARLLFGNGTIRLGKIPHPSPASPAANRDWAGNATRELAKLGVWPES